MRIILGRSAWAKSSDRKSIRGCLEKPGGPLFKSRGVVIGLTTFSDLPRSGGSGVSGIVRIEEAFGLMEEAKATDGNFAQTISRALAE